MKALGIVLAVAMFAILTQTAFAQEEESSNRAFLQYEIQKVDPWGPFVLNLLLNFGIGSFVQGDTTGGLIVAGGQVLGIGLIVAGVSASRTDDQYGYTTTTTTTTTTSSALVYVGAGLAAAASIAGYVFPFTYANAANEKLRRDLGIAVANVSMNDQGLNIALQVEI